ncbi:hypothetical protein CICLE_v10023200mg [Citrus x clementina]|uniref:Uncharacterized protein n=1 Tax=Citrus clementina TaxID=85681 RepID=V4TQI3_CITCL|nr:hypothetical protein CICLE_v10023200mg [Citrus x clementina]
MGLMGSLVRGDIPPFRDPDSSFLKLSNNYLLLASLTTWNSGLVSLYIARCVPLSHHFYSPVIRIRFGSNDL